MVILDRNNINDAEKCVKALVHPDHRNIIISFLSDKIEYANEINDTNWNLNLDLNGRFLRFNVGQEYCIQIRKSECLVLCLRDLLPPELLNRSGDIVFRGYGNKTYDNKTGVINSPILSDVPDCLAKVPNSIGCVVKQRHHYYLSLLERSNRRFIEYAINHTKMLPQNTTAHSIGAVRYLSNFSGKELPNPSFVFESVEKNENRILRKLKKVSDSELKKMVSTTNGVPQKIYARTTGYTRNSYVVELAKRLAHGICKDCGQPAPFINKLTDEPYLEVHHVIPLSEGGKDIIDNVVALCPNCHRKRHYG